MAVRIESTRRGARRGTGRIAEARETLAAFIAYHFIANSKIKHYSNRLVSFWTSTIVHLLYNHLTGSLSEKRFPFTKKQVVGEMIIQSTYLFILSYICMYVLNGQT